jgi:hypothetical protein
MRKFLRENPTIAFGLGLPIVIVVIFLLVSGIPSVLVDDPEYDLIYATEYYGNGNGVQIAVLNQEIQVTYNGNSLGYSTARLWRYSPKTGSVREISIVLPPGLLPAGSREATPEAASQVTPIPVPDLTGVAIDASSVAPDGYEFSSGADGYSNDFIFTGMFSSRYRRQAVLIKNGRSIRLPNTDATYYSNYTRFIGWVVVP